jgi:hypothetical protein
MRAVNATFDNYVRATNKISPETATSIGYFPRVSGAAQKPVCLLERTGFEPPSPVDFTLLRALVYRSWVAIDGATVLG